MTQAEYDMALIQAWRADCSVGMFIARIGGFSECAGLKRVPPSVRMSTMPVRAFTAMFLRKLSDTLWRYPASKDKTIAKNVTRLDLEMRRDVVVSSRRNRERGERRATAALNASNKIQHRAVEAFYGAHNRNEQWNVCK